MGPTADPPARVDDMDDGMDDPVDVSLNADAADVPDDPEIIAQRAEIEATREEMSGTIAEIAERLNPQLLMEQAKQTAHEVTADVAQQTKEKVQELAYEARDATFGRAQEAFGRVQEVVGEKMGGAMGVAREAGYTTMDYIRENPIPLALIGLGLGWLYMSSRKDGESRQSVPNPYDYRGGYAYQPGYQPGYGAGSTTAYAGAGGYAGTTGSEYAGETGGGGMGQTLRDAGERVSEVTDEARGRVADAAGELRDRAGQVVDRVQDRMGDAVGAARQAGYTTMDYIRENPLPLVVTTLGLGWLYMSSRGGSTPTYRSSDYQGEYDYQAGYGRGYVDQGGSGSGGVGQTLQQTRERVADLAGQARERVGDVAGQARERVAGTAGELRDRAGQVVGQVQERVGDVRDRAGQVVEQVQERVGDVRERVQTQAGRAGDAIQNNLQENPLVAGAIAMGLGAAVGMLVPSTEPEKRLMGETRDRLVEQVGQTAQGVVQKVQTVAQETLGTVKDEAQAQGLMRDVQDVAREGLATAEQVARDEGLAPGGTGSTPGGGSLI